MESLFKSLKLILEGHSPVSDNAILYKIGKYKLNWSANANMMERVIKKYKISKSDPRPGIIRWMKETTYPLLKDSKEIIHRDQWDLDSLNGETERQLMHPDYQTVIRHIESHHKRQHDILTIFECSNAKPYCSCNPIKNNFLNNFAEWTDFASMTNPGVVPMEYSMYYPYRYDEWDHFAENDDIANKYVIINKQRFLDYKKKMGYKDVIVVMQHPHTQTLFDELYKDNTDGCKDWLHIVTNDNFHKEYKKKYSSKFNGNNGLMIMRTTSMPYTRECYERVLSSCLEGDAKKRLDKLRDILKIEDRTEKKHALEEFGVVEWKDKGLNSDEDIKESLIVNESTTEFESFINKYISGLKPDKEETYKTIWFTALDCLLAYYGGKTIEQPDDQYWSMKKALDNNSKLQGFAQYCYFIKDSADKLGLSEKDFIEEGDKNGVIQSKLKQQKADI